MKIDKIKINGFGKIKDREIEFKDGINIVYGENEAGKSTILKFITTMLFGASKNKNGKSISDFEQYKPWDDSEFSGKMKYTLENGNQFEIFREFKKKSPILYNDFGEDISKNFAVNKGKEMNFFEQQVGIDESTFLNTALIEQQGIKIEKNTTNHIVQKISNLVSTGDDNISFQKAMDQINKWQNEKIGTDRTKQKPMNIVNDNIKRLINEKNKLQFEQQNLADHATEKEHIIQELEGLQEKKEKLKKEKQIENDNEIKKIETKFKMKISIFLSIFFIILAVLFMVLKKFVLAVMPIVLELINIFFLLKMRKTEQKNNDFDYHKIDKEIEKIDAKMNDLKLKSHILETEKSKIDERLEKLTKIEEELQEQKCVKEELLSLEISYNLAKECLSNAYDEIKHNLSPKFEQKLCEITSNITEGKYKKITVNDETGLSVEVENGSYMPVERLSVGTIDEMYLSLRLSILSEISKENLPILFDESFAYFDNHRLKNIMCYLQDQNYDNQIIIFTCSNREEDVLNDLKIEYHLITLEN